MQILELSDKDVTAAIITRPKDIKENTLEIKKNRKSSREIDILKSQPRVLVPRKIFFKSEAEMKTFSR